MTVYEGRRDAQGGCIVTVDGKPLDPRHDLQKFSEDFEWGYDGDGPHQLAFALLAHHAGPEHAQASYKLLCDTVIAELPAEGWRLTDEEIARTLSGTVQVPMDLATLLRRVRDIKLK